VEVVIPTCESFRDTWQPWIACCRKFWPDRPWPVVLIGFGDMASMPESAGFDEVRAAERDLGWARNIMHGLRGMDGDDLVLMVLDDFWPSNPVDTEAIKAATRLMQRRREVGCFRLQPCPGPAHGIANGDLCGRVPYGVIHRGEPYRVSTQPALWRIGFLRRLLGLVTGRGEAWSFENPAGDGPAATWMDEVYSVLREAPQPWPLETMNTAVTRGVWNLSALEFLDEHGIPRPKSGRSIA